MRDIGERPAVDQCRAALERLDQVGQHRVFQQDRHRAVGLEVARVDRSPVAAIGDHNPPKPRLKVRKVAREAQDRHHFAGHRNVKAALTRKTVGDPAEWSDNLAQCAIVHVEHAPPHHPAQVDFKGVAPIDVVVEHRREQVVRRGDRVKIAREMKVDLVHRHDLRIAAPGAAAFGAEARPQARLTQAQQGALADPVECVG